VAGDGLALSQWNAVEHFFEWFDGGFSLGFLLQKLFISYMVG